MISSAFGAPAGGTTFGGQDGLDWSASRLMTPPNGAGGGGTYFPSMVVGALGEPGVPVVCWALAAGAAAITAATNIPLRRMCLVVFMVVFPSLVALLEFA